MAKSQTPAAKQKRMFQHIEAYYKKKGLSTKRADAIAGATRNSILSAKKKKKK